MTEGLVKAVTSGEWQASYVTLTFGSFRQEMQEIVAFDLKNLSDSLGTEVDFHYDADRIRGVTP